MSDTPRSKPYLWSTWLASYLGGLKCKWSVWRKARYKYDKRQDPGREAFLAEWTRAHNQMIQEFLEKEASKIEWFLKEDEAKFTIKGKAADLSGKPDLVVKEKLVPTPYILEFKTGIQRDSDFEQARIYQFALPKVEFPRVGHYDNFECCVVYRSGICVVDRLPDQDARIVEAIKEIGAGPEPKRVPSVGECSKCDLLNCPDRMESKETKTEEF